MKRNILKHRRQSKSCFFSENEEEYDDDLEFPEGSDRCEKEAIRLALKYNFVTDVTSMVVEEDDEYITKKNLEEKEVKQKDTTQYSYVSRSSANMPQYNMASNVYKNSYSSSNYGSISKMASIPMMATTGRPNLAQRYATFENENINRKIMKLKYVPTCLVTLYTRHSPLLGLLM